MEYTIQSVCDRKTLRDFLALPFRVYREDQHWVPPLTSEVRRVLDPRRNPYFRNANLERFVCYRANESVSRVAIVTNRLHWEKYRTKPAFFGFFESVPDDDAVRLLFHVAEHYCTRVGAESLEGPFNPNHYSELGLQLDHFGESPSFFQPYNPEYYHGLLLNAGFVKTKIVHTRRNAHIRDYIRQRYGDEDVVANSNGYVVRTFRNNEFGNELERIREVFNDAFSDNWHFLPLGRDEYRFSAKFLNFVTVPELVTIVEHHGEPVGILECVQDVNPLIHGLNGTVGPLKYLRYQRQRKSIRNLIVYAVGIKKSHQRSRVYKLLMEALCRSARKYDVLETTWMCTDNPLSIRAAERFGMKPDREFAIYRKELA